MSWFDDALARQTARDLHADPAPTVGEGSDPRQRAAAQVRGIDGLVQLLLNEYGERAYGRTFRGKQYSTKLEAPSQRPGTTAGTVDTWDWHWHLYSYLPNKPGLEVHPHFNDAGTLIQLAIRCQQWSICCLPDEDGIKAALVETYLNASGGLR